MKVDLENWQVKQLREYFGHNDKTQIAHWAYTVFDKAHKKQLTLTDVSQQRELLLDYEEWLNEYPNLKDRKKQVDKYLNK